MKNKIPSTPHDLLNCTWSDFEPAAQELAEMPLSPETLQEFVQGWSQIMGAITEAYSRNNFAVTANTADEEASRRFDRFLEELLPKAMEADQRLKEKLLETGLVPENFEIPIRIIRTEAGLFRQENLPLITSLQQLSNQYDKIVGAQTVTFDGEERTLSAMRLVLQETDRSRREAAWRSVAERQLQDRETLNDLWKQMLETRVQVARNANQPDYRAYRWQEQLRFDYTPADAMRFQDAIEEAVVPAAKRIYERRRQRLALDVLRPWDLSGDPANRAPLKPYNNVPELISKISAVFHQVDPQLGQYFDTMNHEGLLDLENRKNKAPGAYCTSFYVAKRPLIFANSVGLHDDVQTLLHESGHAFHVFESTDVPYFQHTQVPMEFAEVASMSMELLAAPYLAAQFYSPAEAARARIEHMEESILFWPYMAVVDAFQHWVYLNPEDAVDPANCDATWSRLWDRFMGGVSWEGLEDVKATGWHRKLHIFEVPFYYIEYGLAQLGAVQVFANSLKDHKKAVQDYRKALSLGYMVPLPQLFETAGARLAFDADTLKMAVDVLETSIAEQEKLAA